MLPWSLFSLLALTKNDIFFCTPILWIVSPGNHLCYYCVDLIYSSILTSSLLAAELSMHIKLLIHSEIPYETPKLKKKEGMGEGSEHMLMLYCAICCSKLGVWITICGFSYLWPLHNFDMNVQIARGRGSRMHFYLIFDKAFIEWWYFFQCI